MRTKQLWKYFLALLRTHYKSSLFVAIAFGLPWIISDYLTSPDFGRPDTLLTSLLSIATTLLLYAMPFVIFRIVSGDQPGLAISNTFGNLGQVWRYFASLIPRMFFAVAVALALTAALRFLADSTNAYGGVTIYSAISIVLYEVVRFPLIVMPPKLVAENADRKTAVCYSREIIKASPAFRLYVFIDLLPLLAANIVVLSLPPEAALILRFTATIFTGMLSAFLAIALWNANSSLSPME